MRPILLRPLINEKSMLLTKLNQYTFAVDRDADKQVVKKIVEDKFGVNVVEIRMVNIPSKRKNQTSRRGTYHTSPMRKAIVEIKNGQKIPLFEVAQPEEEEVTVTTPEGEVVGKTKEKKSLRGTKVKIERVNEEKKGEKKK